MLKVLGVEPFTVRARLPTVAYEPAANVVKVLLLAGLVRRPRYQLAPARAEDVPGEFPEAVVSTRRPTTSQVGTRRLYLFARYSGIGDGDPFYAGLLLTLASLTVRSMGVVAVVPGDAVVLGGVQRCGHGIRKLTRANHATSLSQIATETPP